MWSTLIGLVCGGIGGVAMLAIAEYVAKQLRFDGDVVLAVGTPLPHQLLGGVRAAAAVIFAIVGAVVGAIFGRLTRRLFKVLPRIFFAAVLACALWTLVQGFVLGRFAPALAQALPFGPMILGAVAYGACVAVVPPPRARAGRGPL
jgi:hypothetical protein